MLDVGVDAVLRGTLDRLRSHDAGDKRIFGEVLVATAFERAAMQVHGWRIPPGSIQLAGHRAHIGTIGMGELMVPGRRDHYRRRESNRSGLIEIVAQRRRTVHIHRADLAHRLGGGGLEAAMGNKVLHFIDGQLVEQLVPVFVVVVLAAQIGQFHAVLGSGGRHDGILIPLLLVGGGVDESLLGVMGHPEVGRSRDGLLVVREVAGAGQVRHIPRGVIESVRRHGLVAAVRVRIGIVGDGVPHRDLLAVEHMVRIGLDGDVVVALLQHVRLSAILVVGRHIVVVKFDAHGLGLAGLQFLGLLECD